jgi:hypothetical protein
MASERLFAGSLLVAALFCASFAHADPTAAQKATARDLMMRGRAQRDRKETNAALQSFEAADAIMHVPTTGVELAKTQAALGLLVEARDTLRRVLRIPARPDDGAAFAQARTAAGTIDADLADRIPSVRLHINGIPDGRTARVTLDGAEVPAAAANELLKVNPGHHGVDVTLEEATAHEDFDIAERETKTVPVTLVVSPSTSRIGARAPDSNVEPVATKTAPTAVEPAPAPHTMRALAIGGFTLAGVGVAVGAVSGLMSISSTGAAKSVCTDNACPRSAQSDIDSAHTTATISTVAFAVAGVGLLVGGIALVVGDHAATDAEARDASAQSSRSRVRVTPWIGAGQAGLRGTF